ncbi:MAG: methionine--tRNA ligase subunit beta [Candidatus Omnitrophica bacterium]|nr:methionine--tRNA ligase subunit beta [Candidatus Omnitrophota bacterium]
MATIEDFKKLDLKVAEILKVEPHPNADRLWVLEVRVGEEVRTIVAGIRAFYTVEELVGKKVVVVANLEPATIRGVTSYGMLLAASAGDRVVVLSPEKDVPSGSIVK